MMIELQEGIQPSIVQKNSYAIVAITKHGVELSRRLHTMFANSDLYYMSKFEKGDEEREAYSAFFRKRANVAADAFSSNIKGLL